MTICYLTPSDRSEKIPPPLVRPQRRGNFFDNRICISKNEFNTLPADQKAGFFLDLEKGWYIPKWSPDDQRHEMAHRLVKASKSPTEIAGAKIEQELAKAKFYSKINTDFLQKFPAAIDPKTGELGLFVISQSEHEKQPEIVPHGTPGTKTVIEFREWADEWRIRTQSESFNLVAPSQSGARISELLSQRGAKKIAESCEYMGMKKGGFKTFVTGTFNEETRKKIQLGETTIQREVSRCMDALQKMYQRGWVAETGEKVAGHSEGLAYCWVVEVPKNESGEDNPHVHMLLGWRVRYRHFKEWASRVERIWGNGYFHLEKIKDCMCAGAYMAKAAGYMTKGSGDESQGEVTGNRYGISENARAPAWVTIGKAQLHSMGQIIADVYDHLTIKYGAQYQERKKLKATLDRTPKESKWTRQQIGERLEQVRAELKKIPVRCNKYQIILKGRTVAGLFLTWAKGETVSRPEWLPELPKELAWQEGREPVAGDSLYFTNLREKFQWLKRKRHAFTDAMCVALVEQWQEFRAEALGAWESYQQLYEVKV